MTVSNLRRPVALGDRLTEVVWVSGSSDDPTYRGWVPKIFTVADDCVPYTKVWLRFVLRGLSWQRGFRGEVKSGCDRG